MVLWRIFEFFWEKCQLNEREELFTRAYVLNVLRICKTKDRMHFVLNIELLLFRDILTCLKSSITSCECFCFAHFFKRFTFSGGVYFCLPRASIAAAAAAAKKKRKTNASKPSSSSRSSFLSLVSSRFVLCFAPRLPRRRFGVLFAPLENPISFWINFPLLFV